MTKRLTNEQFFRKLLAGDLTPDVHPALVQAFVVDSLSKMADTASAAPPSTFDTQFMNGAAWLKAAQGVKAAMDAQYGGA